MSPSSSFLQNQVMAQWGLINRMAKQRFLQEHVAEEAALFVLNELEKNDWRRIRGFEGRAKFTTFLASVVFRLLEDFSRKKYGRRVIPRWISSLGTIWEKLFTLLCMERLPFTDAVETAYHSQRGMRAYSSKEIEKYAEKIIGEIVDCGKKSFEMDMESTVSHVCEGQGDGGNKPEKNERDLFISMLGMQLLGPVVSGEKYKSLEKLVANPVDLTGEERLLLQLCYRENMRPTAAGRLLGLTRFQVHGRLRRTLSKIKKHYEDIGHSDEIRVLLKG